MNRLFVIIVVALLIVGFVGSSFAAYNGVGLITSGRDNTVSSRGVFFVFPGGGPGFGK